MVTWRLMVKIIMAVAKVDRDMEIDGEDNDGCGED